MELPGLCKCADLLPDVQLQPHQQRVADAAKEAPLRKLLVHALGSGKSLSGIAAAEAQGEPFTAVAPASLRQNYKKEIEKFTDRQTPADVLSYTELAQHKPVDKTHTLIFDEAHNLRNPNAGRAQKAMQLADKAKQVLLLSGTPVVNRPGDLAVPLRMLTGKKLTPQQFEDRYVTVKYTYPNLFRRLIGWSSGQELAVNREDELKELLRGHVDYHEPDKPVVPTTYEDVPVNMGPEQTRLYDAMWDKLPWYVKWKLKNDVALSQEELQRTLSFLTGPRQVGLSTYPYQKHPDPLKAFAQSTKLQEAFKRLQTKLKDDRAKALIFSNFIDAGLTPYAAALGRAGIPHGVFHGGLTDAARKRLVDDYNAGKARVALLGPSGTEGLSFKGTQLVQLLDPYWNPVRPKQSVGRGLRYDSHFGLPEDLQNVHVQRFLSRLPPGFFDSALSRIGFDRTHKQLGADDHLAAIARRKEELNKRFMNLLKEVGSERK
jgi:superfamily II DNA or RNA helicase